MSAFVHQGHPARVIFGRGSRVQVGAEAQRLGLTRILLVGSLGLVDEVKASLGERVVATITNAVVHVPVERAQAARALAHASKADGLVAVGGGSAIGLVKAIALDQGQPSIAIPTTYAGSEMTSVWGVTEAGVKRTGRAEGVRPRTVLYDPDLTATLPASIAGPSALNAIAHAMEALYSPNVDPVIELMAEESVRSLSSNLVGEIALTGAWLAGVCLDRATMGLHHKLCHVLGGTFGLPHAEVHSVVLPYVAAYNRESAPRAMQRLARALGVSEAPAGLFDLARKYGAPASLAALGLKEVDLDHAAASAVENAYTNPRPVSRESVRALLQHAWVGSAPQP